MTAIGGAWWLATAMFLAPPVEAPTSAQISQAIAELGSDDYHTRERATEWLWIAGSVAEPALRSALATDDAEIKFRAGTVLEKFKLGIHPGISPTVAALIMQYRSAELRQKQLAVQQLRELQEWKVLLRLLQSETNANYRRALSSTLRDETARQVTLKLHQGEFDEAREYLEFDSALGNAMSQRQLATFLLLRGGIDESVKALLSIPERTPEQTELLVVLLRAQGNHVAVGELVDKRNNPPESLALAVEQQRYADAARLLVGSVLKDKPTPTTEDIGYAAFYLLLAGEEQLYQERLNQLRALADDEGVDPWNVYKVLLLQGRTAEAIEHLKALRPAMALELLAVRQQHQEALAVANIASTTEFDQAWFDKLPVGKQIVDPHQKRVNQFLLALRAGYFLHTLGEVERAQAIFRICRETAQREASPERVIDLRKAELCRLEYRLGLTSQALDDVTLLFGPNLEPPVFASFYPDQYAAATQWWRFLAKHQPEVGYRERLQTVQQLLKPDPKQPSDDWLKAIALAEDALRAPELDKKTAQTDMIVEAFLAHRQRGKAIELLQRDDSLGTLYLRLGDLLRDEQRYEEAAACYERLAKAQPLALYLQGVCETELGRNESGVAKRQLALLLSVENFARQSLFSGLLARNLPKEVENVRDLFLKTSSDFSVIMARQVGNTYSPQEPQLAADYWTKYALSLVRMSSNLVQDEGYISLPYSIHRLRAQGYLASGQREEFRREIALCTAIKPYDFSIVEETLPKLAEKGWTAEADQLFDKRYEQWVKNCQAYPRATSLSNGLAWTAAVSGRKLDDALIYAKQSLVLEPNNPSLYDTLAEVHFKRGEVAEAITAQKKAVELAPGVKLFADRLQKFMEPWPVAH